VQDELAGRLDDTQCLVLDGGPCAVGIESTIIDCTRGHPVLLRPGIWPLDALEAAAGVPMAMPDAHAPRASGTLASHYAPRARVHLMDAPALAVAVAGLDAPTAACTALYSHQPPARAGLRWHAMPEDARACAQELFAVLRALDTPGTQFLWVQTPPLSRDWDGVRDRLQRAAA
jgi:L-threonylcarbamoyladenylate synthase